MNYKRYAALAYALYISSYVLLVIISMGLSSWEMDFGIAYQIAKLILLPIAICAVIASIIWLFKRSKFMEYAVKAMIYVGPIGALVNFFATYLLWWSSKNA
ncbi:hypothetical protein R50072_37910 [Simiduia litorea]